MRFPEVILFMKFRIVLCYGPLFTRSLSRVLQNKGFWKETTCLGQRTRSDDGLRARGLSPM